MRRVFDDFKDRLTKFVEQRDRPALVLDAPDDEALLVLKCVEELDDTRSSELFWSIPTRSAMLRVGSPGSPIASPSFTAAYR